jgi:hypothetical protein
LDLADEVLEACLRELLPPLEDQDYIADIRGFPTPPDLLDF